MIKIIHDCDPGQDDAAAQLLAFGSGRIDIRAITVVGGNVPVEKCATNALKILELTGKTDIPVYKGAEKPLKRVLQTLESVFGDSGMAGGDDLPMPTISPQKQHAVDAFIERFMREDDLHLCATGPLTNIALALQKEPALAARIKSLTLMGGCVYPEPVCGHMGNFPIPDSDEKAEFNFIADPEAANFVLRGGIKNIRLIGLNVTRQALYNNRRDRMLRDLNTRIAHKTADILGTVTEATYKFYAALNETPDDKVCAIHDAVAMAYLIDPALFECTTTHVKIDQRHIGQSLPVKAREQGASSYPVTVATHIRAEAFFALLLQSIENLGKSH